MKTYRKRLFPGGKRGVIAVLACVLAAAAALAGVYLRGERSRIGAPEAAQTEEDLLREAEEAGLPLIRIWTDGGEMPAFSVVEAPDGLQGVSITDNSYQKGTCTIENISSLPALSAKMKIKVRGNASPVYAGAEGKLPYKLVLDEPAGLFEDGTTERKYILLADAGENLKTWLGLQMGKLCGMEWTLKSRYVNLVLNGDYRGVYLLTEAKDGRALGEHVGDDGFLIESDPYWWNEDVYFHSPYMAEQVAFTLQYPELKDMDDNRLNEIEAYMQQVGENILHGNLENIDLNTFSAWICAHDFLGITDIGGANVYYYLEDLPTGEKPAGQMKMGPLWDFDSSFGGPLDAETKERWSGYHSVPYTFFPELFRNDVFFEVYRRKMEELRASLYDSCSLLLTSLCDELEGPIDASREADAKRWGRSWTPVREEAEERLQWLLRRMAWMDTQMTPIIKENGEAVYRRFTADVSDDCERLRVALYDDGYERVRFAVWSDENGQDDIVWYEAGLSEDRFWEAEAPLSRHHSAGVYHIHAYATQNGEETLERSGSAYAASAAAPQLVAVIADDGESMAISFRDNGWEQVRFAVWSDENGQDDIVWYDGKPDDACRWTAAVDLERHKPGDTYIIHVYTTKDDETAMADAMRVA